MQEVFLALLGLFSLGLLLLVPILLIVALVRTGRLAKQVKSLQQDLSRLEARLQARERREGTVAPPAAPEPEPAAQVRTMRAPSPAREAVAPPVPVQVAPPPPAAPAPEAVVAVPVPVAPEPESPPPSAPPPRAPVPPSRPAEPPPGPPKPAFDWESLLGLKGAAWAGGLALVIAGLLFAKLAIDRGFFTPELRVATMLISGVGALIGAELSLRRGYATTANAVSAAGIAILYACFFAAHALYGLLPLALTFGLMVLVTVLACVLAIRYDALIVAVLGLLGGFATPLALSTGVDRPVGLFSYILLLNVGLMAVALRKRWHGLVLLTLAGTFLIQLGWFARFMSPEKLLIGLVVFLVFSLLYLFLPSRAGQDPGVVAQAGALGGIAPFLFVFLLAANPVYTAEWPLLFGFILILDAALVFVALKRGQLLLLLGAAMATGITLPMWAAQGLSTDALWGPSLMGVVLVGLLNAPARLSSWFERAREPMERGLLDAAGLLAACGLGLFAFVLVAKGLGEPPWVFLLLLAALVAVFLERTGEGRLPAVSVVGALALAALVQVWFFRSTAGPDLLRNLAVPLLLGMALSLCAGRRAGASAPAARNEDEAGVVGAAWLALSGLFGCLLSGELGGAPWPLFAALALIDVLLVVSALRRDWTWLLPITLAASALFSVCWQEGRFHPVDLPVVLPIYALFYLAFLALPFALSARLAPHWRQRLAPWLASALAGPLFFLPLYRASVRGWGKAAIGLLPLLMAALSVLALYGLIRRFGPASVGDDPESRRRLSRLALFAAVALGFVALAIPLQLDRQWITVAWALEAAAVWWLLARLPHSGLRAFGALLFAAVAARLLLNFDNLLHYQQRGWPILNWLLYTYGVPALCFLLGARFLRQAESPSGVLKPWRGLAAGTAFTGLLLIFALINLEIADYFSTGDYVAFDQQHGYARDLTTSVAWGLYAIVLLLIGVWRGVRALRMIALGFLVLTVLKVFLYDLSNLGGFARVLSFLGLGVGLIVVSLLYQRFVVVKETRS